MAKLGCGKTPIILQKLEFKNDFLHNLKKKIVEFYTCMAVEVEQAELGIQLSSGKTVGGMLFADDFVGISDSKESLQKLIDVYIVTVVNGDSEQM